MTTMFELPKWAGFVVVYDDGRTVSFQIEKPQVELSVQYERGEVRGDFGELSRMHIPPGRIKATIEGFNSRLWDEGNRAARRPVGEIDYRREIEQ